jgi:HlyD family secretion protein
VTIVKIMIVLEHKDDVLWLPPDAVRAFEGRRFVVVREGERERRVTVRTGIETEDKLEILEGLEEGNVIVGQ